MNNGTSFQGQPGRNLALHYAGLIFSCRQFTMRNTSEVLYVVLIFSLTFRRMDSGWAGQTAPLARNYARNI
jgi:hypothetical protein